jgi:hypothetical protein
VDRIRKKYPQNLQGEQSEQIESYEETVAKDDLPNESMKTDKAMEFDSNKEISDNQEGSLTCTGCGSSCTQDLGFNVPIRRA